MLELKKVTSGCGKSPFLRDISVSFEKEMFTSVIGPNGSGKSTLLKTAVGIVTPDSGELFADGESMTKMKHKETARIIAYLSQGKGTPDMTVEQLVLHGRFPHLGYPRRYTENDRRAALDAMEKTGVADYADRSLSSLSGGMRQNVY
ncbi:MAG: ABC transporter ATP-binding protein, partial [Clostridiaceae bacterium]|nr:ABC transporter ATP-binding protein [Clostridiaceae bacterium]